MVTQRIQLEDLVSPLVYPQISSDRLAVLAKRIGFYEIGAGLLIREFPARGKGCNFQPERATLFGVASDSITIATSYFPNAKKEGRRQSKEPGEQFLLPGEAEDIQRRFGGVANTLFGSAHEIGRLKERQYSENRYMTTQNVLFPLAIVSAAIAAVNTLTPILPDAYASWPLFALEAGAGAVLIAEVGRRIAITNEVRRCNARLNTELSSDYGAYTSMKLGKEAVLKVASSI